MKLKFWNRHDDVVDVLREAKRNLTEDVWAKKDELHINSNKTCLVVEVAKASLYISKPGIYGRVIARLKKVLPEGYAGPIQYNDAPSTTLADIHNLIDKAIAAR